MMDLSRNCSAPLTWYFATKERHHGTATNPGIPRRGSARSVDERLAEAGIEPSVGSVGDSYDNALAETIIGLFKAEVIHRLGPWKTADAVEWETLKWVDWFNNRRLLQPIGNIPPAEAEEKFYEQRNEFDKVA